MHGQTESFRLPITVGRHREMEQITQGISETRIILMEGEAGIGKTTVLGSAEQLARVQGVIVPPIVDFYDTQVHSLQGLEFAIANALDTKSKRSV